MNLGSFKNGCQQNVFIQLYIQYIILNIIKILFKKDLA